MVTFVNKYHGTQYVSSKSPGDSMRLSTVNKIAKELCPYFDPKREFGCSCGMDSVMTNQSRFGVICVGFNRKTGELLFTVTDMGMTF